jgi:hypothetical protein
VKIARVVQMLSKLIDNKPLSVIVYLLKCIWTHACIYTSIKHAHTETHTNTHSHTDLHTGTSAKNYSLQDKTWQLYQLCTHSIIPFYLPIKNADLSTAVPAVVCARMGGRGEGRIIGHSS